MNFRQLHKLIILKFQILATKLINSPPKRRHITPAFETKYNLPNKNKMRHLCLILGAIKSKKLLVGARNSSGKVAV